MPDEPTIPVPMTEVQAGSLRGLAEALVETLGVPANSFTVTNLRDVLAAYDAAVARPAEPRKGMAEGEVRCTCHGVAVSACPSCGGVVGGGA